MAEHQVSRMGKPARRDMGTMVTGRDIGVQRWGLGKSPTETTEVLCNLKPKDLLIWR